MVSVELLNSYYLMFIASRCDRILAFALDKHGAVGSDNRNALSVRTRDGTFADQGGDCAVSGHGPCGEGIDHYVTGPVSAVAGICLVLKDRAGQDRSVREVQLQIADAVPEDRTAHFLLICGEGAVSAVLSALAPAALVGIAGTL